MIKYSYKELTAYALILAGLICLSSCGFSEPGIKVETSYLTIELKVPESVPVDQQEPVTRHGTDLPGTPDENKVACIAFFIFDADNGDIREQYQFANTNAQNESSNPMWDPVTNSFRIPVTAGNKKVYCIANLADFTPLEGVTDLKNVTTIGQLESIVANYTGRVLITENIPMTGNVNVNIAAGDLKKEMKLTRTVARIDIYPSISAELKALGADFKIHGIKLMMAGRTYLLPRGTNTSPTLSGTDWMKNNDYYGNNFDVTVTPTDPQQIYNSGTTYYMTEYYGTSSSCNRMYIRAQYNTQMVYYSLKMSDPATFSSNPAYGGTEYAVERNHVYRYYITFKGKGETTDPLPSSRYMAGDVESSDNISCELQIVEIK